MGRGTEKFRFSVLDLLNFNIGGKDGMTQINTAVLTPRAFKDNLLVIPLQAVGISDIPLVGGKNASLGEMLQQLTPKGIAVPQGFATTAHAYRAFINSAGLEQPLRQLFKNLNIEDVEALRQVGKQARDLILNTPFPDDLNTAIATSYQALCQQYGENTDVAVRSSATAEDLPDASFAGQQETYLNVYGVAGVLEACHKCFASLFTDRAISYRTLRGFEHFSIALSVGVQKMVRSDLATSGVIFSIDPETGFKNVVLVSAAYGLGETVVQGAVNPDEYLVFKPTLKQGHSPILKKRLGSKEIKMIYDLGGGKQTKNVPVPQTEREQFTLADAEVLTLARWACIIEDHYSTVRQMDTPMDIEWAKDGLTGELFIVQARPETVQSQKSAQILKTYKLRNSGTILVRGRAVGEMIGQGQTRVILETHNLDEFQQGEVLVTHRTDPDWEPIMKKASAIVTNQGGRTCHAAIIAREMGIPAIIGCGNATESRFPVPKVRKGAFMRVLFPLKFKKRPLIRSPKNALRSCSTLEIQKKRLVWQPCLVMVWGWLDSNLSSPTKLKFIPRHCCILTRSKAQKTVTPLPNLPRNLTINPSSLWKL
jgi:pyruvate, water dikinase